MWFRSGEVGPSRPSRHRCGLNVTNFYQSRYIFTAGGTPEGRGKVPGRSSTSPIKISSEELLGPLNEIERKYAPSRLFVAGRIELDRKSTRLNSSHMSI